MGAIWRTVNRAPPFRPRRYSQVAALRGRRRSLMPSAIALCQDRQQHVARIPGVVVDRVSPGFHAEVVRKPVEVR